MIKQMILGLLCCTTLFAQQGSDSQQQIEKLLATTVLQQGEVSYSANDILQPLFESDQGLKEICMRDYEYLSLFVNSHKFFNHVRWFSNNLILDANDIAQATEQQLLNEATAWATERGQQTVNPQACLAQGGLEVAARARLIALRKTAFSTQELRTHFNRSIPEFAGTIKLSWLRLPLFNSETGAALGQGERVARYELLDDVAQQINNAPLSWEDAVKKYCKDPITSTHQGKVGYIKRNNTKFAEPFRRQLFSDLGFKRIDDTILRGPIIGDNWVYLARIESVIMRGVIELQLFKDDVHRSLINHTLFEKLAELTTDVNRSILLPLAI